MPIKLKNLKDIATIIKTKYGNSLNHMNFIFCFKKDARSYFIYQEIQGMPIKRIVHHESNNSVTFTASWAAWDNPYAMIADANYDQIESWKDLQDRSRPYNSFIKEGGFPRGHWLSVNRKNKTEKKKKHKSKYDTFVEFRVDKIRRANFNDWGFELYSPTISMIGISAKLSFPYPVTDVHSYVPDADPVAVPSIYSYGFNQHPVVQNEYSAPPTDDNGISHYKVSWQGGSFRIPEFDSEEKVSQVSNPQGISGGQGCDLSSYWSADELEEDDEMFSEEMSDMLQDDEDIILDVGQKKVNLFFGD